MIGAARPNSSADSLVTSSGRSLTLVKRSDLVARRQRYQDRAYWVVKDPLGLRYYRLEEEEYALLNMLDGRKSLDEIKEQYELRFAPQAISFEELSGFLATMHRNGLVWSTAGGQGRVLAERFVERRRREWLGKLTNILSIRFRGIHPEKLFNVVYPLVRWIFARVAVVACLSLILAAVLLVTVQYDEFQARLPTFHQFFTIENAFWLAVVLGVTKICHELGHGLACRHFGGECPEIGFMLLVFTPCLYCNVSDSWMLESKWKRAIVGAAGMYVELIIAALATFGWWYSQPGLFHHLCLSTMFVSSVSTLAFNANPLMRYDGYYILSDLVEVPNLGQQASSLLSRATGNWCLGLEPPDDPFLPRRYVGALVIYAIASAVYRWVIVLSILLFLREWFKPYRLDVVAQLLGTASVVGLVVVPLWKLIRLFRTPGRTEQMNKYRLGATLAALVGLFLGLALVPLPHRVWGTLELEPDNSQRVYVEVPGELVEVCARPGTQVEAGTVLARLRSIDMDLAVGELVGKRDLYRAQVASLRQRRYKDPSAGLAIREIQETLSAVEDELADKEKLRKRLTLVASTAGTVLPPPEVSVTAKPKGELTEWSGLPQSPKNLGCNLTEGTLYCQVGDPQRWAAHIVIDQADISFVKVGQPVEIKLDHLAEQTLSGRVEEIAEVVLDESPRHLSNKSGGELATKTDPAGIERPLVTSYQVRVPVEVPAGQLRIGLRGQAKIQVPWESAATRLLRWFRQTFHFRL